jgi:thymidine phosphorylase
VVALGGGREKKGDPIDYGVGVVHHAKVGSQVTKDQPFLTIHANTQTDWEMAAQRLLAALRWSDEPVEPPPHTLKIIG